MRRPLLFLPFLLLCSALCGAADLPSAAIPGELTVRGRELFAETQNYPSYPAYAEAVHVSTSLPRIELYDMKGELWDPEKSDARAGTKENGIGEIRFCDGYEVKKRVSLKKEFIDFSKIGAREEMPEGTYEIAAMFPENGVALLGYGDARNGVFDVKGHFTRFPPDPEAMIDLRPAPRYSYFVGVRMPDEGYAEGTVAIYGRNGEKVRDITIEKSDINECPSICFSKEGEYFAVAARGDREGNRFSLVDRDGNIIWQKHRDDLETLPECVGNRDPRMSLSPDGTLLVAGIIKITTESGQRVTFRDRGPKILRVYTVCFSKNGAVKWTKPYESGGYAFDDYGHVLSFSKGELLVLDQETGEILRRMSFHETIMADVSSRGGMTIVSGVTKVRRGIHNYENWGSVRLLNAQGELLWKMEHIDYRERREFVLADDGTLACVTPEGVTTLSFKQ